MANWTQRDLQNKKIAMVDGVYKKLEVGKSRKTAKVKTLPVLMPGDMPKPNAKIMNATKVEVSGVKFDSKLELLMYERLTAANISFEFQKKYTCQPSFKYKGETIRPISIYVDFYLTDRHVIVDTKGFNTAMSKLKYKLLKFLFFKVGDEPEIFMPGTKTEVDFLISRLKYDKI